MINKYFKILFIIFIIYRLEFTFVYPVILSNLFSFAQLILLYRPVMVLDVCRKLMGLVFFGNKIKKFGVGRIEGGFNGLDSGAGYRPGRETFDRIGVIRRRRG